MQCPDIRHFRKPVIKYIEFRRWERNQFFFVDGILVYIATVNFHKIHQQAQRHIGIDGTLMFDKEHMLVADDEADVVLDPSEEGFIDCGECYVIRCCLVVEKSLIDFRQALCIIEDITEKRILVGAFRISHGRVTSCLYYTISILLRQGLPRSSEPSVFQDEEHGQDVHEPCHVAELA